MRRPARMATPLADPTRGRRPAAAVTATRLRPHGAWLQLLAVGLHFAAHDMHIDPASRGDCVIDAVRAIEQ